MKDQIALFDLDGTLADYHTQIEMDLRKMMCPHEIWMPNIHDNYNLPPYLEARKQAITRQEGWWLKLQCFKLGWDIFDIAKSIGFCIEILTKGSIKKSMAWKEKVEWCEKYISEPYGITITRNKGMVYGKVLVDDYPSYIEEWLKWRPRGLVIMPAHKYNETFTHPNVIRYDGKNLDRVQKCLQRAFTREDGEEVDWGNSEKK